MNNRYKKIIYRAISVFMIAFVLAHLVPIPINKELKAIEIKLDNPHYLVDCTIQISGRYYINLFKEDAFEGKISVSNYPLTSKEMYKVIFNKDGYHLDYIVTNKPSILDREHYHFGLINSDLIFHRMVIRVYKENAIYKDEYPELSRIGGSWSTIDGYCIVPLVNSREDAINILKVHELIPSDY